MRKRAVVAHFSPSERSFPRELASVGRSTLQRAAQERQIQSQVSLWEGESERERDTEREPQRERERKKKRY